MGLKKFKAMLKERLKFTICFVNDEDHCFIKEEEKYIKVDKCGSEPESRNYHN